MPMPRPPHEREVPPTVPDDAATRIVPPSEERVAELPPEPGYRRVERTLDPLEAEVAALGDEMRRLRLSLVGALVLAVTAIVIAVFALLQQEQSRPDRSRLAGLEERLDEQREREEELRERLARLDDRVDRVSRARSEGSDRLQDIGQAVEQVAEGQAALDRRVRQAERDTAARDARIDELARQVEQLEQLSSP